MKMTLTKGLALRSIVQSDGYVRYEFSPLRREKAVFRVCAGDGPRHMVSKTLSTRRVFDKQRIAGRSSPLDISVQAKK